MEQAGTASLDMAHGPSSSASVLGIPPSSPSAAWAGKEPAQPSWPAVTWARCRAASGWGGVTQPRLVGDGAQLSKETAQNFQNKQLVTPIFGRTGTPEILLWGVSYDDPLQPKGLFPHPQLP